MEDVAAVKPHPQATPTNLVTQLQDIVPVVFRNLSKTRQGSHEDNSHKKAVTSVPMEISAAALTSSSISSVSTELRSALLMSARTPESGRG